MIFLSIFKFVFPFILIVFGLFQTFIYFQLKKRIGSWPVVAAKIIKSVLLDYNDVNGERIYEANIEYEYEFRGKIYTVDTPLLKGYEVFTKWDREYELQKKYKEGDVVNAKVCPHASEICYLEVSKFDWPSAILVPLGIILYVLFFDHGRISFMEYNKWVKHDVQKARASYPRR